MLGVFVLVESADSEWRGVVDEGEEVEEVGLTAVLPLSVVDLVVDVDAAAAVAGAEDNVAAVLAFLRFFKRPGKGHNPVKQKGRVREGKKQKSKNTEGREERRQNMRGIENGRKGVSMSQT